MTFGRFEAGDGAGVSRSQDPTFFSEVHDYRTVRIADLNSQGTGLKNELAAGAALNFDSPYATTDIYAAHGSKKLDAPEADIDTPMDLNFVPETVGGEKTNEFGDKFKVNEKGEVVIFTYNENGQDGDTFMVFDSDEKGIRQFMHNETAWERGADGKWRILNGTEDGSFEFTIDIDSRGVRVEGPGAFMVPVPA